MIKSILFTEQPIAIPPISLPDREIGACLEFHGIVRVMEQNDVLQGLQYEAYQPMATRLLERIFDELNTAHPCAETLFIHRLGWVPVGEASLFLRILASHRGEALQFCAKAIDRMKAEVPIWKASLARPAGPITEIAS